MTEEEKRKQRYALVVKSNEIIRKTRYGLSVTEQRIILYLTSKIKPTDTELFEYEIDIKEFCEVCGIDYRQNLAFVKDTIKNLRDKSFWLKKPDKSETTVGWIDKATLYEDSGFVKIKLDNDLIPYLLQLRDNFTQYELMAVLALKSKYSLRLYELFKSYEYLQKYETSVEDLRKILMAEKEYTKIADFKRYVIDKALDEINSFTDIEVSYEVTKKRKAITGFIFTIQKAEDWNGEYSGTQLYLDGKIPSKGKQNKDYIAFKNQMSLWDEEK